MRVLMLSRWSVNPYQTLLVRELRKTAVDVIERDLDGETLHDTIREVRPDVIHLQNIHAGIRRLIPYAQALLDARQRRIPIVWTVHELRDNDSRFGLGDRVATAFTARVADAMVVHCDRARIALARHDSKITTIPLGHYRDWYPNNVTRAEAREALGIDANAFVFLFFGWIRPYKGVDRLRDAFARLDRSHARLLVAGRVADDDVQLYFNACDVVVLPYRRVLTSGAAVLAMSFRRACIASRIGCLPDVLDDGGAFFIEGDGLLDAMQRAVASRERLDAMGQHNLERAMQWRWEEIAATTLRVYASSRA
jgi:beta-1,4-mannosyltransferase